MTADRPADRYQPALDGLRALAVAAVIAYHLGLHWMRGGYLGVDLFFVLSGYLITGLLYAEWEKSGTIRLRAFWSRRARRLLPALLAVLLVLGVWLAAGGPGLNRYTLRADGLAALFYAANWHFISVHRSYFAQFSAPSPLEHTWSLAIEEQFYLLWPLLVTGLLALGRRRLTIACTGFLAVASAVTMAVLMHPGHDPSRVYFGTDTRAFELLVGAVLALLLAHRPRLTATARRVLDLAALASATAIAGLWVTAGGPPEWMFKGGMFAAALLVAVVVWNVTEADRGLLGRALSVAPLRWLGRVSYGLYLWHWPVIVVVSPSTTPLRGLALDAVRVGLTVAVTAVSFYALEMPIRSGRLSGWQARILTPAATALTAGVLVAATVPTATVVAAVASPTAAAAASTPAASTTAAGPSTPAPDATTVSPPPTRLTLRRAISPNDPLRVMLIGDSVMYDDEPAITAALAATGAARTVELAFPGWGLTRSNNWQADWPKNLAQFRPDVVMGMWSWDNEAARADRAGYQELLDQAVTVLTSGPHAASAVAFLEFPRSGPRIGQTAGQAASEEAGRQAWNLVAAREAAARPDTTVFLPVAGSLELKGQFSPWLPSGDGTWIRARKLDAEHLCPTGAARFAAAVVAQLGPLVDLAPAGTGWWSASWARNSRYNDPPGSCPDDRPPAALVSQLGG